MKRFRHSSRSRGAAALIAAYAIALQAFFAAAGLGWSGVASAASGGSFIVCLDRNDAGNAHGDGPHCASCTLSQAFSPAVPAGAPISAEFSAAERPDVTGRPVTQNYDVRAGPARAPPQAV